jgi:hypothetical protein
MRSRVRRYDPLRDLILSLRAAAAQIDQPVARAIAARKATAIPRTLTERAHGRKAMLAGLGRAQMRALPDLPPERWADARSVLRAAADALDSRFDLVSETNFTGRMVRSGKTAISAMH